MKPRCHPALERLEPRGTVHVGNRGEPRTPLGPDRENARHEAGQPRSSRRQIEIPVGRLGGRHGCKGPELLAVLDVPIEPIAHLARVRRGQNAPVAKSARAELRGAIHPADDAAGGELIRDPFDQHRVVQLLDELVVLTRRLRQFPAVHRRPPERMIGHIAVGVAEENPIGIQRRPERAACVAGSGRDEHALEAGLGENPRVRDAVERHAAAETQIGKAGLPAERARDVHQGVFENPLDTRGAIRETPSVRRLEVDRLVRVARTPEQLDESRRIRLPGRRLILEVLEVEGERAVRRAPDQLADRVGHGWPPVGGEAHDFVFVLVHGEAQEGGERRIQHAEGVWISDLPAQRDAGAAAGTPLSLADRQRGPLADAIGGQDRGAAGRRREKSRRRVRLVMAGEQDLRPRHAQLRGDDAPHPDLFAERVLDGVGKGPPGVRKGAERGGQDPVELPHAPFVKHHGIEVGRLQARVIQTPFDGAERECRVVLAARQTLFLYGTGGHAVDHQRGGRVVVMRGDAEDLHVNTGWPTARCPLVRLASSRAFRGVQRVWPAKQTARVPRNTRR